MLRTTCLLVLGAGLVGVPLTAAEPPVVQFGETPHSVDVKIGGRLFTTYQHTPDPARPLVAAGILQTKPVLHPVLSPSGVPLTRAYPYATVEGEATDHPHHQGIYFTYDDVGPEMDDFWGNSKEPLPAIRHVRLLRSQGGKGVGTLAAVSRWVGKGGRDLLEEEREMVFRAAGEGQYQIDFAIRLKALDREIAFGDTKEGMFAFRVAQWLTDKQTGRYLSLGGRRGREGRLGQTREVGAPAGPEGRQDAGHRDPRSPDEHQRADLLARARLRLLQREPARAAGLPEGAPGAGSEGLRPQARTGRLGAVQVPGRRVRGGSAPPQIEEVYRQFAR